MLSVFTGQDTFGFLLLNKFNAVGWMLLCAISQSTYFAVSYSGGLDRMLSSIKLSEACAKYSRRSAVMYASLAWIFYLLNCVS